MRKICVFTGSRAEYSLLHGLLEKIDAEPTLCLQIIASGMHLSSEFGMTIRKIREDGYKPDETVEMLVSGDTPISICKSMGLALIGYGEAIQRLKPDMVVVLGDRFETFCLAAAAQVCRIPLAHIHGGETTEGAIDDAFRHSITKMAHLHFASCEPYRQRIIQLGEAPDRVFNVGATGVENIRRAPLLDRDQLADSIGFGLARPYFLVTFHPVTLEQSTSEAQFLTLLDALDTFQEFNVIFTKSNSDTDGRVINCLIDDYVKKHANRCMAVTSLGMQCYLSAMKFCDVVVGNSSSGIIEAPTFKVPTVNVGDRQKGRIQPTSILNCPPDANAIRQAISLALSSGFQENLTGVTNPYDKPDTCSTIVEILEKKDILGITKKTFFDIEFSLA